MDERSGRKIKGKRDDEEKDREEELEERGGGGTWEYTRKTGNRKPDGL